MDFVSRALAGFDQATLVLAVGQFVGLPLVLERVARSFFQRTHVNVSSAADAAVLSQRLARAFMACTLVQGSVRVLLQQEHRSLNLWSSTALGRYYMLGTVFFYLFDTSLLALQRAKTYDLWIHHLFAVVMFSYFLASKASEMGGMLILFSELLVPWGFMLFYFKLNKLQAHSFFKTIAYGGVATLMTRMSIWVWLQYRLFWPEYHHAPSFLLYTGIPVTVGSLLLDLYWTRLYLSNFPAHKRAVAALGGKPAPGFWQAVTTKQQK